MGIMRMKLTKGKALLAGCIAMAIGHVAVAKDIKIAVVGAMSGPVALVLGSEGGGPGALTRKLCDAAVTLEMAPGQATGVDSYNVSVAAGILCYDVMRRRLAKK